MKNTFQVHIIIIFLHQFLSSAITYYSNRDLNLEIMIVDMLGRIYVIGNFILQLLILLVYIVGECINSPTQLITIVNCVGEFIRSLMERRLYKSEAVT